jgi:hypothetical protein
VHSIARVLSEIVCSSLVNFSESTRMIGIIVHSASNPTYTLQRQSCIVTPERLMFLETGKRNCCSRESFERARTLKVVWTRSSRQTNPLAAHRHQRRRRPTNNSIIRGIRAFIAYHFYRRESEFSRSQGRQHVTGAALLHFRARRGCTGYNPRIPLRNDGG